MFGSVVYKTYFMGQSCSAFQDRDGLALFVVLQQLVDLKGQIVFISKQDTERERKQVNAGLQRTQLGLPEQTRAKCAHRSPCALLQAHIHVNMYSLLPHTHSTHSLQTDQKAYIHSSFTQNSLD